MNLTAEQLLFLASKGLTLEDVAHLISLAGNASSTQSGAARRQAAYRARKHNALRNADGKFESSEADDGVTRDVTGDVTCYVTRPSLLEDISTTSNSRDNPLSERTRRNVTRNVTRKSRRCPEDWQPGSTVYDAGHECGLTDGQIEREIKNIRDYEFPKGHSDWDAVGRRWMRNTRPDPKGRPVLTAIPTQSADDIERRKRADAQRRARAMEAYG